MQADISDMVVVRDAYKRYGQGSTAVLNGLNMSVQTGTIYALLGASGCGKTTLLNCVVGRKNLDYGIIKLGVKKRSQIGYMPQDVALFQEFTICEIFTFYGILYGMTPSAVKENGRGLVEMLELPLPSRYIHSLSGGQQRRVSFAIALLHNPLLLILDEPTVGVDPILCHNIWNYLVKVASEEKKTIIITTHYIEEAKQSHTIGLMRRGVLLTEEPPHHLMANQNCTNLEDAFFQLSRKQQEVLDSEKLKGIKHEYPRVPASSVPCPINNEVWFRMSRFLAQLFKNIRWLQRNIAIFLFLLLLPLVQAYLFCVAYGHNPKNLPLGIVSEELISIRRTCDDPFFNYSAYSTLLECEVPKSYSCHYIKQLEKTFRLAFYDDLIKAKTAASKNEIWGFLHISRNFTNSLEERIANGLNTNDFSIDQSIISATLDMSNFIVSSLIKRDLEKGVIELVKDILLICGIPKKLGEMPVKVQNAIFGNNEPVLTHSTAAAFVCSFVFYFTLTYTSGSILMEKMSGLIERIMVAGMTSSEIVFAHLVVQFFLMTAQTSIMMLVLYIMFLHPLSGSVALIIALLYCVAFVGIAVGYFLSEIFNEDRLIAYAGTGFLLTLFMVSGIIWPIEGAHISLKSWCRAFPIVAAAESFHSIAMKGFIYSHKVVYMGFVSCAVWIVIFSFLTYYISWRKKGS